MRGVANWGAQNNSISRHCVEAAAAAGRVAKLEMHSGCWINIEILPLEGLEESSGIKGHKKWFPKQRRTQAGANRRVKEQQEGISANHVEDIFRPL